MKMLAQRALALMLALLLLGAALAENDIYAYVVKAGYQPTTSQADAAQNTCVFKVGSARSTITWTLDGQQCRIAEKEDIGKLQALYLDLLGQAAWDGAQYIDASGAALFGYHSEGQAVEDEASSLEAYAQKVSEYIKGSEMRDYVLNKNTKRFHSPTCGDIARIKDTNREDVHEYRQKLIDDGYRPCGHCKP